MPSTLPLPVRAAVEARLGALAGIHRVGGGCIDPAAMVEGADGRRAFLKWSSGPGPDRYGVEARGLRALGERGGLPVPQVLGFSADRPVGVDGGDDAMPRAPSPRKPHSRRSQGPPSPWLLLEWIEPGHRTEATDRALGTGLAELHRPLPVGTLAGWEEEGWIATLPQSNRPNAHWPTFWFQSRLAPQWERARRSGALPASADRGFLALEGVLPEVLAGWEADGMSLLHGDLWGGNVLISADGIPHLVDPAVYRGHREVDLAMLDLFGSPGAAFMDAYQERLPLTPGFRARRTAYQLYPLLVHVNLFGGGYAEQALSRIRELVR